MQDHAYTKISGALLVLLRPIAKILLQSGIGFREFAELAKIAFVDVASQEYGIRGRPTNISRVAVMTGLTRKEVRRIRDHIEEGQPTAEVKSTPLAQVLRRWHSEPKYTDAQGLPLSLPFDSEDEPSFTELVRDFGGDIPPGAMRTEFKRVGAVEEDSKGNLKALRRIARPHELDDRLVTYLLHASYPLMKNIAHNIELEPGNGTWPQLTAWSKRIRKSDSTRLMRVCRDRIEETGASIDDVFVAYETLHDSAEKVDLEETTSVAVGFFYFEESDESMRYVWEA